MNKSSKKSLLYILVIALFIWPASYLIYGLQKPDANANRLNDIVQSDEFLMGLQGKQGQGCVALKFMDDIDTVFIGSSHAYASLDPHAIRKASGGKPIGVCAIAAWNTDFLHEFINFLSDEDISPKRIIWVADGASPLHITQNEKRLAYAQSLLGDPAQQKKISDAWVKNIDENNPPLLLSAATYNDRLAKHHEQIMALPLAAVTEVLGRYKFVRERNLGSVMSHAKVNPLNENNLRRFCTDLKLRGIELDIVMSAIPKRISELVQEKGPDLKKPSVEAYLKDHTPCARNVISRPLEAWDLDDRYFTNRRIREDYDYSIWLKPEELNAMYQELIPDEQAWFFSPDHVNPVGAMIYSEKLGELIRD